MPWRSLIPPGLTIGSSRPPKASFQPVQPGRRNDAMELSKATSSQPLTVNAAPKTVPERRDPRSPRPTLDVIGLRSGTLLRMPGLGELIVLLLLILLPTVGYRIGYRLGRAEGRLQGRNDAEDKRLQGRNEEDDRRIELPKATARLGPGAAGDDR